jgi:succinate dehydrogenase flavin-adding protein (antitoxin of CptAB toxin-antitoxin module)
VGEFDRIRWHCRRGLLELDIVLDRFLQGSLATLTTEELEAFKLLLQYSDNDLWDLVSGRSQPAAGAQARVVNLLRAL